MIENGQRDVPWPRPTLWAEVVTPRILTGVSPLVRYILFLYYDLGKTDREIGDIVGLHFTTIHEMRRGFATSVQSSSASSTLNTISQSQ